MKIEQLNLSVRARNALRRAGVRTTEQLMSLDPEDLRRFRSVGEKTEHEIRKVIGVLEELERKEKTEPAAHGSFLHGYQEGKEGMRRSVIRELTKMARHLNRDQQEVISEACEMVKMLEIL